MVVVVAAVGTGSKVLVVHNLLPSSFNGADGLFGIRMFEAVIQSTRGSLLVDRQAEKLGGFHLFAVLLPSSITCTVIRHRIVVAAGNFRCAKAPNANTLVLFVE